MTKQTLHTELIVLCDYATVSREGKLSINGIFDEIRVQKFPGGIPRAFFVTTISGTPNTNYKLNLKLENKSSGTTINTTNIETTTSPNGRSNLLIELLGLAFNEEGDYTFKIYHENKEVGSTLLKVNQASEIINPLKYKLPN